MPKLSALSYVLHVNLYTASNHDMVCVCVCDKMCTNTPNTNV